MYDHFTKEQIGITHGSLRNYGLSHEQPYRHDKYKVVIREGILISKQGNRGRKTTQNIESK
jgi:hypothetical protein